MYNGASTGGFRTTLVEEKEEDYEATRRDSAAAATRLALESEPITRLIEPRASTSPWDDNVDHRRRRCELNEVLARYIYNQA